MAHNINFGRSKTAGECARVSLRSQIISLCKTGKSVAQICEELGCARETAWKWIDRFKEEGDVTTRPKTGAPRKTTAEQERSLIQRTLASPTMTPIESVRAAGLYHVSLTTVRKRLQEAGIHSCTHDLKEVLTSQNIQDDLFFSDPYEYQEEGNLSATHVPGKPCVKTAGQDCSIFQKTVVNSVIMVTDNATTQVSQDYRRGESTFSLNDLTVEDKQLELVLVKEEKEVKDDLEEGVEGTQIETPIKQEPLPWNELESMENVMAVGGADAGSSEISSASAEMLMACTSDLGEDQGPLLICGDVINNNTKSKRINGDKPFICQHCAYRTNRKSYLEKHLFRHGVGDEPLVCGFCAFMADSKDDLGKHLLTHEGIRYKPLGCNQCEYRTHCKTRLGQHLLIHESVRDRPYVCNQCEYRTDYKCNLRKHILKHNSVRDKPFACNKCEYRTDDRGNLRKHLATHNSARDKPFVCSICEYRTDRKGSLTKHLAIHDH